MPSIVHLAKLGLVRADMQQEAHFELDMLVAAAAKGMLAVQERLAAADKLVGMDILEVVDNLVDNLVAQDMNIPVEVASNFVDNFLMQNTAPPAEVVGN